MEYQQIAERIMESLRNIMESVSPLIGKLVSGIFSLMEKLADGISLLMGKLAESIPKLIDSIQSLSGAHVWLVIAVLVFAICSVLTMITFRQFSRHRDDFKEDLSSEPEAVLIDTGKNTGISRYTISKKPVMIGRVEANDNTTYDSIVVPEITVGRRHAVIEYDDGSFWLQDQGSVNGCFINGQRVEERYRLKDGDTLKIHKFPFHFIEQFKSDRVNLEEPAEDSKRESDFNITMPQNILAFDSEPTMVSPNDVLVDHARRQDNHSDISSFEKGTGASPQALYRDESQEKYRHLKQNGERDLSLSSDESIKNNIQEMTIQLYMSPNDDKTLRLYSESLDSPPEQQPDYSQEEKAVFSQLSMLPDMDGKVMEALGDFFSETQDELRPQLEITKKGNKLAQIGRFSSRD